MAQPTHEQHRRHADTLYALSVAMLPSCGRQHLIYATLSPPHFFSPQWPVATFRPIIEAVNFDCLYSVDGLFFFSISIFRDVGADVYPSKNTAAC